MKKFNYSMESLLKIKVKLEEQAKIAYGNARIRLTQEEEKQKLLEMKKEAYENELRNLRSDRLNIIKIKQCQEAIEIMKVSIKQQILIVKNATQKLEVARIRLNDAMVDRKIQDKLKEKALEEYMLEMDAEERKEVDELISFNYSNPTLSKEDR